MEPPKSFCGPLGSMDLQLRTTGLTEVQWDPKAVNPQKIVWKHHILLVILLNFNKKNHIVVKKK